MYGHVRIILTTATPITGLARFAPAKPLLSQSATRPSCSPIHESDIDVVTTPSSPLSTASQLLRPQPTPPAPFCNLRCIHLAQLWRTPLALPAPLRISNDSPADSATTGTTPPKHLFSGYPAWDGDADSFKKLDAHSHRPPAGPRDAPRPASRSALSMYIRSRTPDGASLDDASLPPFVVQDFLEVLKTACLPKNIAARALQKVYAIRQGPVQPLALFMGEFVRWLWSG
ncbi:hypothetical protein E4U19_002614 [Claviceps sp. Clav32 group G5]|nr:hypothetical protein E4U19_002614 [Claviceps sp. Clav32 group G5]